MHQKWQISSIDTYRVAPIVATFGVVNHEFPIYLFLSKFDICHSKLLQLEKHHL